MNVGLYSDNAGVVGTLLATGHASTIPVFGTCCQLVTVNIKSTAVTAGTQYWIVVTQTIRMLRTLPASSLRPIWRLSAATKAWPDGSPLRRTLPLPPLAARSHKRINHFDSQGREQSRPYFS